MNKCAETKAFAANFESFSANAAIDGLYARFSTGSINDMKGFSRQHDADAFVFQLPCGEK